MTKKKRLNPRQQVFVQEVIKPENTQADAYRIAYGQHLPTTTASPAATKLLQRPEVIEKIADVLDRKYANISERSADLLQEYLENPDLDPEFKLKVIAQLAKFKGWEAAKVTKNMHLKADMGKYKLPGSE